MHLEVGKVCLPIEQWDNESFCSIPTLSSPFFLSSKNIIFAHNLVSNANTLYNKTN